MSENIEDYKAKYLLTDIRSYECAKRERYERMRTEVKKMSDDIARLVSIVDACRDAGIPLYPVDDKPYQDGHVIISEKHGVIGKVGVYVHGRESKGVAVRAYDLADDSELLVYVDVSGTIIVPRLNPTTTDSAMEDIILGIDNLKNGLTEYVNREIWDRLAIYEPNGHRPVLGNKRLTPNE